MLTLLNISNSTDLEEGLFDTLFQSLEAIVEKDYEGFLSTMREDMRKEEVPGVATFFNEDNKIMLYDIQAVDIAYHSTGTGHDYVVLVDGMADESGPNGILFNMSGAFQLSKDEDGKWWVVSVK